MLEMLSLEIMRGSVIIISDNVYLQKSFRKERGDVFIFCPRGRGRKGGGSRDHEY